MGMAVIHSVRSILKNTMRCSVGAVLHFQPTKSDFGTNAQAYANNTAIEGEEAYGNDNGDTDISGVVKRLCNQGRLKEALDILHVMDMQGIRPDSSIYASLLDECIRRKALPEGKLLHALMVDAGFMCDIFLGTKIVIMYANCGSLVDARRVLDGLPERNEVSWTVMISAYARHGFGEEAWVAFYEMQCTGLQPNQFTFASVLPACATLADLQRGRQVHRDIIKTSCQSNIFVGSALVDMYVKCQSMDDARQVFDKMTERNVVTWNTIIAGYARNGIVDEAHNLFQRMPVQNVISWKTLMAGYLQNGRVGEALSLFQKMPVRDVVSWNVMITGYVQNGRVDDGHSFFQKMPERNVVSWNMMIAGYAQNGNVDDALKLFQKMYERDLVSWNAMISGYVQNGDFKEALKLFSQMQPLGVEPNPVTFASVLPACANWAGLEYGKEIHESIIRSGFQSDVFVENALVDMYAKCGSIKDAGQVFEKMPKRNVVSWNAMIAGYAIHGYGKVALQLFEQMQHSGIKPDHVTFVGVLSACCHAGLVGEGWRYFDHMNRIYHIVPAVDHYCCMVDLLGRAGHLHEAQDFINKMPIKPNAAVWGSLLGACRIHTNKELGEFVAERLFDLDPQNAARYVLLSNIYAADGKWYLVEKMRKLIKDRSVKKRPGCSWITVRNRVHTFLVEDTSHPQTCEIYAKLESLSVQMKEAGYRPNTNVGLHGVEEE